MNVSLDLVCHLLLQEAVSKYDVVIQNLEFARDLQKQFAIIGVDVGY